MFYPILFGLALQIISSYHITPTHNHFSYSYYTPSWVYKKVYKHNRISKSQLRRLKKKQSNKNDYKNVNEYKYNSHNDTKNNIIRDNTISEFDANYNAVIVCELPIGLIQPISNYF
jgi:hypothetical protein